MDSFGLIILLINTPPLTASFFLTLYWFLKANKMIGGRLKNFVIWMLIAMLSFSAYSTIVYFNSILGILTGDWTLLRQILGLTTILSYLVSAYQLNNLFK